MGRPDRPEQGLVNHQAKLLCQLLADQAGFTIGRQDELNKLAFQVIEESWDELTADLPEKLDLRQQLTVLTTCVFRLSERIKDKYGRMNV